MSKHTKPSLYICRTISEACIGAVSAPNCGFVLQISEADGVRYAKSATSTIFGPVEKNWVAPSQEFVKNLVLDTLDAGDYDLWLASYDNDLADELAEDVEDAGFKTHRLTGELPTSITNPFSLFETRRMRNEPGQSSTSQSFVQVDPIEYGEVKVGQIILIRMRITETGCEIYYTDQAGVFLGLHGQLPYVLDEQGTERLKEVESSIRYINWGRDYVNGRQVKTQMAIFDIPADVDSMLAKALLPKKKNTAHL